MSDDRLDSWKEIAAYLKRSVGTVTRWEREEGLPVRRHLHSKSGTVYAYKHELDAWWTKRGQQLDQSTSPADVVPQPRHRKIIVAASALAVVLALTAIAWLWVGRRSVPARPRVVPLTTYLGTEGPPSLSPDGNQVAFERGGDIFVKQVDGEALVQLTSTATEEFAPAWSPDGRQIAFTRAGEGVFLTSPLGGGERKIVDVRTPLLLKTTAWTPDAQSLVISELTTPICASLFVVSIATGQKTRLTSPPEPSIGDGWPAVSPDGRSVAFARYSQDTVANIHLVPLAGGQPIQLTSDKASIFGVVWTATGELLFSSDRSGASRLWRVSAKPVSNPVVTPLDIAGEDARFPSVSRPAAGSPVRLAYQRFVQNLDIRRSELVGEGIPQHHLKPSRAFITSTKSEDHPRYSPDGSKIAFVSTRSGTPEIWVCARDATNPRRLSSMGGPIVNLLHRLPCAGGGSASPEILQLSIASRHTGRHVESTVAWTNTPGFAISPDGRWLLYSSLESSDADLILIDNFH